MSTAASGLETWHIQIRLDREDDGWYQVELQDFAADEHSSDGRQGAAAEVAEVIDLVAEQLAAGR